MDSTLDRINRYDELSAVEQEALINEVREKPEHREALASAQALWLICSGAKKHPANISERHVAELVAAETTGTDRSDTHRREFFAAVREAISSRSDLQLAYLDLRRRNEELHAESEDPLATLERLRAHAGISAPRTNLRRVNLSRFRLAAAASMAVVLAYGALAIISAGSTSERHQMASLNEIALDYEGIRLRSTNATRDAASERYADALETIRSSRSSMLGLFPRYDADALATSLDDLQAVVAGEPSDSWLALEARYVKGKVLIQLGRDLDAQAQLREVVEQDGAHAAQARRALDWLERSP
ncbi:hypothetical protein BH23BAC4_BH23BAC4_15370 [soil metagenome]